MTEYSGMIGTRTGNRHRAESTPNQDYACYAVLPDNMGIVAAVSDGAGSAPKSKTGSETAAREAAARAWKTAVRQGKSIDPSQCAREGITGARRALEAKGRMEQSPLEDYHATLIVAVLTGNRVTAAHIGDGASIVRTHGTYKMLTIPARGEYPNETFFVTMEEYENLVATNSADQATEVLLCTDGAQNELIDFRHKRVQEQTARSAAEAAAGNGTGWNPALRRGGPNLTWLRTDPSPVMCQWLENAETTHGDDATLLVIRNSGGQP